MPRLLRRTLRVLLLLFLLMNIIAAMHAWHFTHFDKDITEKTSEKSLSFGQKISIALTGVKMPRPGNIQVPDTSYETVHIPSNKNLEAWWIHIAEAKGTVLLFHGYGGSKGGLLDKARIFRSAGYSTLLVDFMGAGGSDGNQCTIGYLESVEIRDAVSYLRGHGEKNLLLFGTSMGAAAVLKSLAEDSLAVQAAIIECPFASMTQTVKNRFHMQGVPVFPMASLLLFWGSVENGFNAFKHNPDQYARKVTVPVLYFYGGRDEKVMRWETDSIYGHLAGPKRIVCFPEARHENYLSRYGPQWEHEVRSFLKALE